MPLMQSTLPSVVPDWDVPFDMATTFANPQTLTATGYVNAIQARSISASVAGSAN
ncbi:hypothetical protein [Rhizobium sp. Leaf262]|uniref:hypothetical protein n=1 Tax=Rhizobium sp. Leaf262 TaxID=1736312 RepID=UPI001FCE1650|nr:hypothetical protein [Rhizobium sp. Leaf262]